VRLLIVDDDSVFREELAELLATDGHDTKAVPSVAAATEALESEEFDLVFTDLKMPRHGGLELLEAVRTRWPRTPAVMITGFATVDSAVEAMKLGAFDYIRKPFRIEQIQSVLRLALEESKFEAVESSPKALDALLHRWTEREGLAVLLVTPRGVRSRDRLVVVSSESLDPSHLLDAVDDFLGRHDRAALLVEGIDRIFEGARRSDLLEFVGKLKERTASHGPLVVTYDPARTTTADAQDLRTALVGLRTRSTLEALSNPIRRAVLRRSYEGPVTFSQALEAAQLDDSPKLSFHLRRLVEEGLIRHQGEEYRITPRGEESLKLLAAWDALVATDALTSAVIPETPK
jgi:FixJ family two-component response regulator/DNA-binding transcriptional ArsR family regulator